MKNLLKKKVKLLEESDFNFRLQGGEKHSDLIIASLELINTNEAINLECKWFQMSKSSQELREIKGIQGAFY